MKILGFEAKKGQQVHPNFATNIAMDFLSDAFCAPEERSGS